MLSISRNTIKKYLQNFQTLDLRYEEALELSYSELAECSMRSLLSFYRHEGLFFDSRDDSRNVGPVIMFLLFGYNFDEQTGIQPQLLNVISL
jgi:hypothetical protein